MKRRRWMWWGVVVVVSLVRTAPSPAKECGGPHLEIPQGLERPQASGSTVNVTGSMGLMP